MRVDYKNTIKFPSLTLQKELKEIARDIIIPDLQKGIDGSIDIDDRQLPRNEEATIKRKGGDKPLIETGKLRRSFYFKAAGKSLVIITLKNDRIDIGGYLQDGIMSKRGPKQYRFFGITKWAEDKAKEYIEDVIKDRLDNVKA